MADETDIDRALESLNVPPTGGSWPPAADLSRRAEGRHRRRVALVSTTTALVLVAALVVGLVSAGSTRSPQPVESAAGGVRTEAGPGGSTHLVVSIARADLSGASAAEAATAAAEQEFSLELLRGELGQSGAANVLVSPMSADIALAMLELGAGGATAADIAKTLQSSGVSPYRQALGWAGLVAAFQRAESAGEVQTADSLWTQVGLRVQSAFLREAAATFGNASYQTNFGKADGADAARAINAWVRQETAGRISQLFSPQALAPADVVLVNALRFHAAWAGEDFRAATVEERPFFTAAGGKAMVPTLVDNQDSFPESDTSTYDAVQLPYSNHRFAALLLMPKTTTLSSFLHGLSPAGLSQIVSHLSVSSGELYMPQLDESSRQSLNQVLSAMGLAPLFVSADLTPMLGNSAPQQVLSAVVQADSLKVNQWGTDAAAATGVVVTPTSALVSSAPLDFNHPYVFLIRDTVTGTILFSSVVNNPGAA